MNWRSRIVGSGAESPDTLLANPQNWRIHPKAQQDALEGVLNEVGWVQEVIVNRTTGHLVDGHLRVSLAMRRNEPEIPVKYVDLSADEERLVLATIDPLSAMAATDTEQLDALLREVHSGEAAVQEMLAELAENSGLYVQPGSPSPLIPDDEVRLLEDAPVRVAPGDIWALGEHRLWCGNACDGERVVALAAGHRPVAALIDPPFEMAARDQAQAVAAAMGAEPLNVLLWTGMIPAIEAPPLVRNRGYRLSHLLIWDRIEVHRAARAKEHHNPTITCTFLPVWRRDGEPARFTPEAALGYLEDLGVDTKSGFPQLLRVGRRADSDHGNGGAYAKPKALVAALMAAYGDQGPILDLFSGSGTAFEVGSDLGIVIVGVEMDPRRCDVAIARWEAHTGQVAEQVSGSH